MALFILHDAAGGGSGSLNPDQAMLDLKAIAADDPGLRFDTLTRNHQKVCYTRSHEGVPSARLDTLANNDFMPDYGDGPQNTNILILPVLSNFTLKDGRLITRNAGVVLPPRHSRLPYAHFNPTDDCLMIYDTTQHDGTGYCATRRDDGMKDLWTPNPVLLYHELSHAFRVVTNSQLRLTDRCQPSSPEERAAILDENEMRIQMAKIKGTTPSLRDPDNYCGAVCAVVPIEPIAPSISDVPQFPETKSVDNNRGLQGMVWSMDEAGDGYELLVQLFNSLDRVVYCMAGTRALLFDASSRRLQVHLTDQGLETGIGAMAVEPLFQAIGPSSASWLVVRLPRTFIMLSTAPSTGNEVTVDEYVVAEAAKIELKIAWADRMFTQDVASSNSPMSTWQQHSLSLGFAP